MGRRGLLLGAIAGTSSAFGVGALTARAASAASNGAAVPTHSSVPYRYTLKKLVQDASASTTDIGNPILLNTGDTYKIAFSWTPTNLSPGGALTFRANTDQWFYYFLMFYPNGEIGFAIEDQGNYYDMARVKRLVDPTHPALFTLTMSHYTFSVADNAAPGSPTILTWTDSNTSRPPCLDVSHVTNAGTKAVWDFVAGSPTA
jgi:hypothetical protein